MLGLTKILSAKRFFNKISILLIMFTLIKNPVHSWSTPEIVSATTGYNAAPALATSTSGNAVVVWINQSAPDFIIQSSYYDGISWTMETISDLDINTDAVVGMDDVGNAIVAWLHFDGTDYTVQTATYLVGTGWGGPSTLSTSIGNGAPSLSINGDGFIAIAWVDTTMDIVNVATSTIGNSWTITPVSTVTNNNAEPKVGVDSSGNIVVIWSEGSTGAVMASSYTGTWSTPEEISSGSDNMMIDLSVGANGDAIAVWNNSSDLSVVASNYISGTWTLAGTIGVGPTINPLAGAYNSDGFATWGNLSSSNIEATNYFSTTWETPVDISTLSFNDDPSLAIDQIGTALVAWVNYSNNQIMTNQFPNGGVPGVEEQISLENYNFDPQISTAGSLTVAAWQAYIDNDLVIQISID